MNIGDLFSKVASGFTTPPAAAPQPAAPTGPLPNGDQSQLGKPGAAAATDDAANLQQGKQPAAENKDAPLAEFANLWKDPPAGTPSNDDVFQLLNADPAKVNEVASKINFTSGISPELAQKALGGDVKALMQMLNGVAQQAFATATQASSALVDRQSSLAVDHMKKTLPNQFKKLSVSNDLASENPQFSNPAVQPILSLIQERLASSYPEATPAELKAHAKKYFSGVVDVFAPGAGAALASQNAAETGDGDEGANFMQRLQQKQQASNNFDWDTWAGQSSSK